MASHSTQSQQSALGQLSLFDQLFQVMDVLTSWQNRARERHQLQELSPEMLRDMGIHPLDAAHEAAKPFWRR